MNALAREEGSANSFLFFHLRIQFRAELRAFGIEIELIFHVLFMGVLSRSVMCLPCLFLALIMRVLELKNVKRQMEELV